VGGKGGGGGRGEKWTKPCMHIWIIKEKWKKKNKKKNKYGSGDLDSNEPSENILNKNWEFNDI
jgi:hypothetical protein